MESNEETIKTPQKNKEEINDEDETYSESRKSQNIKDLKSIRTQTDSDIDHNK